MSRSSTCVTPDEKILAKYEKKIECAILWDIIATDDVNQYLKSPAAACQKFIDACKKLCDSEEISIKTPGVYKKFEDFAKCIDHGLRQTILMWACIFGHNYIVERLVAAGLPRKYINAQDGYGRTALMYALLYGNTDCALTLMNHMRYVTNEGNPVTKDDQGAFVGDGKTVAASDVTQQITNHCSDGIYLLDAQERNAFSYVFWAASVDDTILVDKGEREMSAIDYSLQFGSLKVYDLLRKVKKFSPSARETIHILRIAAGLESPHVDCLLTHYFAGDKAKLFS